MATSTIPPWRLVKDPWPDPRAPFADLVVLIDSYLHPRSKYASGGKFPVNYKGRS